MKKTVLASAVLCALSTGAWAATTDYSNQVLNTGISVIGSGNSMTGDNVQITGSGLNDHAGRNEGIYVGTGSSAQFGGEFLNIQFHTDDTTHEFAGLQVNAKGEETTLDVSAKSTVIDVSGPGASSKWGYGLFINGFDGSKVGGAVVKFTGQDVVVRTTTENYTSQSVTVKEKNTLRFDNSGDVTIEAYSPFGVTVVDGQGTLVFNNQGNVLLKGEILPGDKTAQTNSIGMQGENADWNITNQVNEFRIEVSGAGVDNDGTTYSSGTSGILAEGEGMNVNMNAQQFVIDMNIGSDVVDDSPEGHTATQAYGIHVTTGAQMTIGSATQTNISVNQGIGSAYGIAVESGSFVAIEGDLTIQVKAKDDAYAIYLGSTTSTENKGVSLLADASSSASTGLKISGANNYIEGDVAVKSGSAISFENGQTTLVGNVVADADTVVTLSEGTVELAEGSNLTASGEVKSIGGQIVLNEAKAGSVKIGTLAAGSTLTAVASSELNDKLGGDIETFSQAINISSGAQGTTLTMREGLVAGEKTGQMTESGALDKASVTEKTNTLMQSSLELATAAPLALNRIMMNDVRKRLGDIRTSNGTHGAWARYDGGRLSGEGDLENDFNTIQVGFDTLPSDNAPRVGVAFSYTDSDSEYARGSADMKAYSLAAYGTWMSEDGMFFDLIGRMGTADTDMVVDGLHKGSMNNLALSLSGEFGWRFDVTDSIYVELQVEATYTFINGDNLSLSTANYDVDDVHSLLGRIGFAAGLKCPNERGNVYVRASAVHEFLGDSEIAGVNGASRAVYEIDGKDTWVEYGIGANFNITQSTYMWADVERTSGGTLDEDWRATVGVRYSW